MLTSPYPENNPSELRQEGVVEKLYERSFEKLSASPLIQKSTEREWSNEYASKWNGCVHILMPMHSRLGSRYTLRRTSSTVKVDFRRENEAVSTKSQHTFTKQHVETL
ncbi:MAG: hypothetical protein AAB209_09360 [Bacteroidota bacterium]